MGERPRIVTLGDLVADLVVPVRLPVAAGEHQRTGPVSLEPGGTGNFLIAGARLGGHMQAMGAVGDDPFGREVLKVLAAEGVEVEGMQPNPGSTTTLVLNLVSAKAEHVFLGRFGQGPPVGLNEKWRDDLAGAVAVFVSGYALGEGRLRELIAEAAALAAAEGIPVYFDPGPPIASIPPDELGPLLAASRVILLTEEEAGPFARAASVGGPEGLLELGPQAVVLKQGAAGCTLLQAGSAEPVEGFPMRARDTAGAGDCFAAALVIGRARGLSWSEALRLANAAGAAKVARIGTGRSMPDAAAVQGILDRFDVSLPWRLG